MSGYAYLPGLREEGDEVDVSAFPTRTRSRKTLLGRVIDWLRR